MASMSPFMTSNRRGDPWFSVGLASSFPDITDSDGTVSELRFCDQDLARGCKVFHVSRADSSQAAEVDQSDMADAGFSPSTELRDQVLVFQYRGKFHAVNNQCPHSSFPLSNGTPFDIEDFGIILSAGITCPKHGWSFDLFSGAGDRGQYQLGVWEVQLRPVSNVNALGSHVGLANAQAEDDREVWVRRKQRIG